MPLCGHVAAYTPLFLTTSPTPGKTGWNLTGPPPPRLYLGAQPLRQFVAQNLSHLRVDCYDRRMNRAIANELFPLLRDHPELWQAALQLPQLTDEMPLDAALHLICDTAEVSSDLRDTLVGLLVGRQ